jgi:hypothetical protein
MGSSALSESEGSARGRDGDGGCVVGIVRSKQRTRTNALSNNYTVACGNAAATASSCTRERACKRGRTHLGVRRRCCALLLVVAASLILAMVVTSSSRLHGPTSRCLLCYSPACVRCFRRPGVQLDSNQARPGRNDWTSGGIAGIRGLQASPDTPSTERVSGGACTVRCTPEPVCHAVTDSMLSSCWWPLRSRDTGRH